MSLERIFVRNYSENDYQKILDAIILFKSKDNKKTEDRLKNFSECFLNVEFIGLKIQQSEQKYKNKKRLLRVIGYDEPPYKISRCNYNPNAVEQRCNIEGKPVFYGTEFISSGIVESIIRTKENLIDRYNTEFVGRRFIIGLWEFDFNDLYINSYELHNTLPDQRFVGIRERAQKGFVNSIAKKEQIEIETLLRISKIYNDEFYSSDISLTSIFCFHRMYNQKVHAIIYPSAIEQISSLNYCIHPDIAKDPERLKPLYFNYCELVPVKPEYLALGSIGYKVTQVGLPSDEKDFIHWLTDKDSMKRYLINDGTPNMRIG